jgi:hypothetical protein
LKRQELGLLFSTYLTTYQAHALKGAAAAAYDISDNGAPTGSAASPV